MGRHHGAGGVLRIDPHRSQAAAKQLLGEAFGGFVICDRYVGYHWLDVLQQQLCWAHAIRQPGRAVPSAKALPASSGTNCSTPRTR